MHVFCPSAVFWKILKRLTVSARSALSQLQLRHISCRWCVDGKEKQSAVMFIRRSFNVRHTGDLSSFFGSRISGNVCGRKCSRALPPCPRSRRGTWERPTRSWQGISASLNLQLDDVRGYSIRCFKTSSNSATVLDCSCAGATLKIILQLFNLIMRKIFPEVEAEVVLLPPVQQKYLPLFFPRDSVFPFSSCQTWTGCSAPCSSLSRGNTRTRINLRELSGRAHLVFMSGFRWFMVSGCLLNIHQLPTLTQGARLSCVRNPQRQKIGPTYFHELCDVNREVPHAAGCLASTELCSLRNFHLMAHFKHLSSTWECCVQRESLGLFENWTQSQGLKRLQFTDMPTWDCSEILKGIFLSHFSVESLNVILKHLSSTHEIPSS